MQGEPLLGAAAAEAVGGGRRGGVGHGDVAVEGRSVPVSVGRMLALAAHRLLDQLVPDDLGADLRVAPRL